MAQPRQRRERGDGLGRGHVELAMEEPSSWGLMDPSVEGGKELPLLS